jgi:hypothetical protein
VRRNTSMISAVDQPINILMTVLDFQGLQGSMSRLCRVPS